MCNRLQLTSSRSTPYHPQGNAKLERISRNLEEGLAKYCEERHEVCEERHEERHQPFLMAYRSAIRASADQSHFRLLSGKEIRLSIDMLYRTLPT